jgi:hypothetical protein
MPSNDRFPLPHRQSPDGGTRRQDFRRFAYLIGLDAVARRRSRRCSAPPVVRMGNVASDAV